MTEIIPIQKLQLNNEEVNSVNATELHHELNISKDFSSWIKAQIKRADLELNIDYVLLTQKGEQKKGRGGHNQQQYILTIEFAKHIAMMSQSKRAKEIRDYFIGIEKKYIQTLKNNNTEERITYFVENRFNAIAEELRSIKDQVLEDAKERQEVRLLLQQSSIATSNLTRALENLPLETTQLAFIRQSVEDKGRELAEARGLHSEIVIPAIFREIKRFYDVPSYTYLSRDDYHSVLHTIRTFTI